LIGRPRSSFHSSLLVREETKLESTLYELLDPVAFRAATKG